MEEQKQQGQGETSIVGTLRGHTTMCGQPSALVGKIQEGKRKGQPQVKQREDNAIASLDSYTRKWLNKKQRKSEERGCA